MSAKDGKQTEDLDREERERKDVGRGAETGGKHCGGHEGCVCRERCWESVLLEHVSFDTIDYRM